MKRIQDVKTVYICPDHNEKYHHRKLHMDALLSDMGFTNFHHYKSGTEQYPLCLVRATIDILQQNMDEPVLILEDDVESTGLCEFEQPEGADAIYFGLSRYGGSRTIDLWEGHSSFLPYSADQVRVMNMLGGHAILYISRRYKQAIIDKFMEFYNIKYNSDVLMSRIQRDYLVLANKRPTFWQSAKFNPIGLEQATKFQLVEREGVIIQT